MCQWVCGERTTAAPPSLSRTPPCTLRPLIFLRVLPCKNLQMSLATSIDFRESFSQITKPQVGCGKTLSLHLLSEAKVVLCDLVRRGRGEERRGRKKELGDAQSVGATGCLLTKKCQEFKNRDAEAECGSCLQC